MLHNSIKALAYRDFGRLRRISRGARSGAVRPLACGRSPATRLRLMRNICGSATGIVVADGPALDAYWHERSYRHLALPLLVGKADAARECQKHRERSEFRLVSFTPSGVC